MSEHPSGDFVLSSKHPALRGFLEMLLLHSRLSKAEQEVVLELPGRASNFRSRVDIVSPGGISIMRVLWRAAFGGVRSNAGRPAANDRAAYRRRCATSTPSSSRGPAGPLRGPRPQCSSFSTSTCGTRPSVILISLSHSGETGWLRQPYSRNGSATSGARARRLAWPTSFAKWV